MLEGNFLIVVVPMIVVIVIIIVIAIFARRYVKVPPDKVLVVYGSKTTIPVYNEKGKFVRRRSVGYRLLQGGGTFVWPVIERAGWMTLETLTVEVEVPEVITKMGVPLTVEGVAQVKIKSDDVSIRTAAEQLLDKPMPEIIEICRKTLEGHIRGTCATLAVEEINADRAALSSKIQEEAVPDFQRLGIQITIFVIKDIKDRVGYLEALGKKRTAEVKRDAEVGAANAVRDQTIQVAQARRDGEIGQAEAVQRDLVIKVTQAQRDGAVMRTQREAEISEAEKKRDVLKAGYIAEIKTAEATRDMAYDINLSIQKQELIRQQMQIEIERKVKEVQLKEQEIQMQQRAQIAEQVVPAEKQADAMAAMADGERRKLIAVAEGEKAKLSLTGEGEAARIKAIAEAEAYKIKITGDAEASKTLAVGTAEAKAMQLKADAWKQYLDSAKLAMIVDKLPMIAEAMAKPLENTQKVIIMGTEGAGGLVRTTAEAIAKLPAVVEALTGTNMIDLVGQVSDTIRGEKKK